MKWGRVCESATSLSFTKRMDSALVLAEAIDESQLRSQLLIDSPAPLLRNMRFYVS